MSAPLLAAADPGEAPILGAILSDWIDETPWMPRLHSRAEDAGFVAGLIAKGSVRVARDGAPVGFIARQGREIDALYVARSAQRRGVGRALIVEAQQLVPHLALWTFAANEAARDFYAACGFFETGGTVGENDEGLPDIRMEWTV